MINRNGVNNKTKTKATQQIAQSIECEMNSNMYAIENVHMDQICVDNRMSINSCGFTFNFHNHHSDIHANSLHMQINN